MSYSQAQFEEDLAGLYPNNYEELFQKLNSLLKTLSNRSENDSDTTSTALICYADSITKEGRSPLQALKEFLIDQSLPELLPLVHLLPFYPWDTDRGFSVKDYYQVSPENGSWSDIKDLSKHCALMFDFVANHASIDNPLVQSALIEKHLDSSHPRYGLVERYKDFVITYDALSKPSEKALALLARPRANPVLTQYVVYENSAGEPQALLGDKPPQGGTELGRGYVWTTFSRGKDKDDVEQTRQVDLNFRNPAVFEEVCKILLFYIEKGATHIRLDAIGYIWKKIGSNSLHEPEAHAIIRALSYFLRQASSAAISIAEVNEPQANAFTYLGSRTRPECDMVYQFTHFPLVVHALHTAKSSFYVDWLKTLDEPAGRQFITVLGSHDGLGMKPIRGILPNTEMEKLAETLVDYHKCLPNYAKLPGGKEIIYEICSTPWQLINNLNVHEEYYVRLARYLAVVRLGFLVRGIPAFYISGLIGAKNYAPKEGIDENRTVNRERYELGALRERLSGSDGETYRAVRRLLAFRNSQPAFFHSQEPARPLKTEKESVIFAHIPAAQADKGLYLIQSVTEEKLDLEAVIGQLPQLQGHSQTLGPYGAYWLTDSGVLTEA